MKICRNGHERPKNENRCKTCQKIWREVNRDKLLKMGKDYYKANKEHLAIDHKEYNKANYEQVSKYRKMWKQDNKEQLKEKQATYYKANREKIIASQKAYTIKNINKVTAYNKQYKQAHKEQMVIYQRIYLSNRKTNDSMFKLKCYIRTRIRSSYINQGYKKLSKTAKILGCSFEFLMSHLIASALRNYGYWADFNKYHIDHIIPVSSAKTEEELLKLNHFNNLQFLYPQHNLEKGNRLDWIIPKIFEKTL